MSAQSKQYEGLARKYVAANYGPFPGLVLEHGSGAWVYDVAGKKYLDLLSAYSSVVAGHRERRLVEALAEQARQLGTVARAFHTKELVLFARKLALLCGMNKVLPMNSGAEAVETAIKIARKWGYVRKGIQKDKAEIIVFDKNFHGRTTTIVGFSSTSQYKDLFGPCTPGFVSVPFGDTLALQAAINENTAAILAEPIQGEGGVVLPPEGFISNVRDLCTDRNVLFIADEIQTGLGRTGKMFCCEHYDVKPDLYILGKALGGGMYPVSAVVGKDSVMGVLKPGDHGSTFGGNPVACAVARTALMIIKSDNLVQKAAEMGEYFLSQLRGIVSPNIKEVRGMGLLIGVELVESTKSAYDFSHDMVRRGLLVKETHKTVLRFAPPLTITRHQIDFALNIIRDVLK